MSVVWKGIYMWNDYNPNPVGNRTDDCSVRAIAKALDVPWETAYIMLFKTGYLMGEMPHRNLVIGAVLRDSGFSREFPPSDCPDCYSVNDFCEMNPEGKFVVFSQDHVATIDNGDLWDTWDSSGNTINYVWYKDAKPIFKEEE